MQHRDAFHSPRVESQPRQFRPTMSAVNNEAKMPRLSEMAKPFTGPLAFQKRIAAVISVVTLASKTELNAFSYAVFSATCSYSPSAIASRNRPQMGAIVSQKR